MARTKRTARKSTGGKGPRKLLQVFGIVRAARRTGTSSSVPPPPSEEKKDPLTLTDQANVESGYKLILSKPLGKKKRKKKRNKNPGRSFSKAALKKFLLNNSKTIMSDVIGIADSLGEGGVYFGELESHIAYFDLKEALDRKWGDRNEGIMTKINQKIMLNFLSERGVWISVLKRKVVDQMVGTNIVHVPISLSHSEGSEDDTKLTGKKRNRNFMENVLKVLALGPDNEKRRNLIDQFVEEKVQERMRTVNSRISNLPPLKINDNNNNENNISSVQFKYLGGVTFPAIPHQPPPQQLQQHPPLHSTTTVSMTIPPPPPHHNPPTTTIPEFRHRPPRPQQLPPRPQQHRSERSESPLPRTTTTTYRQTSSNYPPSRYSPREDNKYRYERRREYQDERRSDDYDDRRRR